MADNLYVLIAQGVYDRGILGVFSTEQRARDEAEALWPQTDGYHRFRIEPVEIDVPYEPDFNLVSWTGGDLATGSAEINVRHDHERVVRETPATEEGTDA